MTAPMQEGRQASTDRRRNRVAAAISAAQRDGTPLTASAIARAAAVDRAFLYRHRDLLDALHTAAREPAAPHTAGPEATRASLLADLANANARNTRLVTRGAQLEARLSKALGEEAWRASGMAAPTDVAELRTRITYLEQHTIELTVPWRNAKPNSTPPGQPTGT